ncbi:hypothetical protein NCS56_00749800 [Fusarium sp. Ph1]|nr:hypothetical protein NCS56_00749800 [Fusarium sp. Ph1]
MSSRPQGGDPYGRQRYHGPIKGDESVDESEECLRLVCYEGGASNEERTSSVFGDNRHSRSRDRPSNHPGGMTPQGHSGLGRYHDRDLLHQHNIQYLSLYGTNHVRQSVKNISEAVIRQHREVPGVTSEGIGNDPELHRLEEVGTLSMVEGYFIPLLSPPADSCVHCAKKQTLYSGVVPHLESLEAPRPPAPTMLYGYSLGMFGAAEREQSAGSVLVEAEATRSCLLYPFLTIDMQGDGPISTGSLWAASNTCLVSSAACVALVNKLEHRVRQVPALFTRVAPELNNVAFGIAMSGTEARLFVTYQMDEGKYGMYKAKSFLLQDPDDHIRFRKCVLNIIDWGQKRLVKIREALTYLRLHGANQGMMPDFMYRDDDYRHGEI